MQEKYWFHFIIAIPAREPKDLRLGFFALSERIRSTAMHVFVLTFFSFILDILDWTFQVHWTFQSLEKAVSVALRCSVK